MVKFIIRRILWFFPVVLTILVVVFLLMHAMPGGPWDSGGPARAMSNLSMDENTRRALNQRYGLDDPIWKQFTGFLIGRNGLDGKFICGLVCGNMGPSYRQTGRSVEDILFSAPKGKTIFDSRFAFTLRLSSYAFFMALLIGVPLGIAAAMRVGTWLDYVIKGFSTLLISMPNFVIGLLFIIILGGQLHLIVISPTNWQQFDPRVWFAPIFILGIGMLAAFIRLTRTSILEVMNQDYVRTARGKGASERRIVYWHILKNAAIPILTFSAPALIELFAGSFVIETMYGYPGMGKEFVDSVVRRDYSMIMGVVLVYTVLIMGTNLMVDVLYGVIDPRIRLDSEA